MSLTMNSKLSNVVFLLLRLLLNKIVFTFSVENVFMINGSITIWYNHMLQTSIAEKVKPDLNLILFVVKSF